MALIKMGNEIPYNDVPVPDCPLEHPRAPPPPQYAKRYALPCASTASHSSTALEKPFEELSGDLTCREERTPRSAPSLPGDSQHCCSSIGTSGRDNNLPVQDVTSRIPSTTRALRSARVCCLSYNYHCQTEHSASMAFHVEPARSCWICPREATRGFSQGSASGEDAS